MYVTPTNDAETRRAAGANLWNLLRIVKGILALCLALAAVFLAAGSWKWRRGWICIIGIVTMYGVSMAVVRFRAPELFTARFNWRQHEVKPHDRRFIALSLPLYFALPIVAGLDAVRFRWSAMPFSTVYLGLTLLAFGVGLVTWAKLTNAFAESTMRVQPERHHSTVTAGPYRIVRHPMYAGTMLVFPAAALIFGSVWALVVGLLLDVLFIWRTAKEDHSLRHELADYEAFVTVTRYRLIPGLW